jgi:hypothetical protein
MEDEQIQMREQWYINNEVDKTRGGFTSEKHLTLLVSTTVSRNATTGSVGEDRRQSDEIQTEILR